MSNTYNYVDTQGGMQQFQADTPEAALSGAPNIAHDSGVQLVQPPKNNLVVSSGSANTEFNNHSSELTKMLGQLGNVNNPNPNADMPTVGNTNDAYTQMLDKISASSDASTKALVGTINAARANRGNALDTQYRDYKQGLQLLGIQHNEAQATPDLLMGHIQQAENEHQQKLQALDVETNKALMDAEKAQNEGDLSILKEKMNYVKELKAEKQNLLKNIADNLSYETKIAETEAAQYYDKLTTLNPADQEAFLTALAKKFNVSLGSLTRAMVTEKERRDKLALETADKKSIIANRGNKGGAGTNASKKTLVAGIDKIFTDTTKDANGYSVLGDDGYIDPDAYMQAYQTWISSGFPISEFKTKYPAKDYVNPDSYGKLPVNLKPKTTAGNKS